MPVKAKAAQAKADQTAAQTAAQDQTEVFIRCMAAVRRNSQSYLDRKFSSVMPCTVTGMNPCTKELTIHGLQDYAPDCVLPATPDNERLVQEFVEVLNRLEYLVIKVQERSLVVPGCGHANIEKYAEYVSALENSHKELKEKECHSSSKKPK